MVPLPEDLKLAIRADYESWLETPYEPTAEDEIPEHESEKFFYTVVHAPRGDYFAFGPDVPNTLDLNKITT